MWEYNIPIESHIKMTDNPAKLLLSAIGILGDYVRLILENFNVDSSSSNINFANSFFEAYLNTKPIVDEYTKNYIALYFYLFFFGASHLCLTYRFQTYKILQKDI